MSPQDMANCAYALSIMSFDIENPSDVSFRGAHESLISMITSAGRVLLPMASTADNSNSSDDDALDDSYGSNVDHSIDAENLDIVNDDDDARSSASSVRQDERSIKPRGRQQHHHQSALSKVEIEQLRIFAHYVKVCMIQ